VLSRKRGVPGDHRSGCSQEYVSGWRAQRSKVEVLENEAVGSKVQLEGGPGLACAGGCVHMHWEEDWGYDVVPSRANSLPARAANGLIRNAMTSLSRRSGVAMFLVGAAAPMMEGGVSGSVWRNVWLALRYCRWERFGEGWCSPIKSPSSHPSSSLQKVTLNLAP